MNRCAERYTRRWTGAGTFVRAATLWASSASTSGRVSALRMVCCSFCSASSSFSWSCRFLSSVYDKQITKQTVTSSSGEDLFVLRPGLRVCFQFRREWQEIRLQVREREGGRETKGDGERGWLRVGWAGSEEESIHNETKKDKTYKKRGETSPSQ